MGVAISAAVVDCLLNTFCSKVKDQRLYLVRWRLNFKGDKHANQWYTICFKFCWFWQYFIYPKLDTSYVKYGPDIINYTQNKVLIHKIIIFYHGFIANRQKYNDVTFLIFNELRGNGRGEAKGCMLLFTSLVALISNSRRIEYQNKTFP